MVSSAEDTTLTAADAAPRGHLTMLGNPPRRREPDWELIAESIPHIVWLAGSDGGTEYLNRRGTDYLGRTAEAAYRWEWVALVHPDDAARALTAWNAAVRDGVAFELEYRIRRHDGAFRWHAFRASPIRDMQGDIVNWIGTATDVDDRKQLELGLIDAEREVVEGLEFAARLQAAAPLGFAFVDRDCRVVRIDGRLAAIAGLPLADQLGKSPLDLAPDLWRQVEAAFRTVLETGRDIRNLTVVGTTAVDAGRSHQWLVSCYPVRSGGEIAGVGFVANDVTEQAEAEAFGSAVMSQVADGVYTVDGDGRLTSMNRSATRMLGWTEDELRGRRMSDVVHVTGAGVSTSQAISGMFARKDGSTFPVVYSSAPVGLGSVVDNVVVFRDVSDDAAATNLIRLVIADTHAMVSEAFQLLLSRQEGIDVVGSAATSAATLAAVATLQPDVVLIDCALPDLDGVATARLIKSAAPAASVILMSEVHDETVVADAIAAGCAGVLDKDRAWVELVGAVRAAYHGQTAITHANLQRVLPRLVNGRGRLDFLTDREREVLACISEGLSNRAVAERLGVAANTVRNHVQRILYKLNVHSRLEAVVVAAHEQP